MLNSNDENSHYQTDGNRNGMNEDLNSQLELKENFFYEKLSFYKNLKWKSEKISARYCS